MKKRNLLLVLIAVTCFPAIARAQEMGEWRTLRGLRTVYLVVEDERTGRFNVADGLTGDQLRQDVSQKLRNAGLSIITTQTDWLKTAGTPYLHISLHYSVTPARKYFCNLELTLQQEVAMVRDPSIKLQTRTWGVKLDEFDVVDLQQARKELAKLVDQFIEDFRRAN